MRNDDKIGPDASQAPVQGSPPAPSPAAPPKDSAQDPMDALRERLGNEAGEKLAADASEREADAHGAVEDRFRLLLDSRVMRQIIFLLATAMAFYWLAQNIQIVPSLLHKLLAQMAPIVIGLFLAIIINIPTRSIENKLFGKSWKMRDEIRRSVKRPVSILISLILILGLFSIFVVLFLPEIERAISTFGKELPRYLNEGGSSLERFVGEHPELKAFLDSIDFKYQDVAERIVTWFSRWSTDFMKSTLSIAVNIMNSFVTFLLALIFALYAIGQKEKLGLSARKLAYAYLPEPKADRIIDIVSMAGDVFTEYFMAQGMEAMILGGLVFIAASIFSFPYALIISVLTAIFALIPIFGAYIAGGIGFTLILLTTGFARAAAYVLMFLVVQQFEGNVIYPRVVGKRVGLPPIWVFVSVTLGGKFFGFAGFLLAVPITSVFYMLIKLHSEQRVKHRNIPARKIEESPLQRSKAAKALQAAETSQFPAFLRKSIAYLRSRFAERSFGKKKK